MRYEGHFVNDVKSGKGKFTWPDNSSYEGIFKNGDPSTNGKHIGPNGIIYEGNSIRNKKEGFRKMSIPRALYSPSFSSDGSWEGDYFVYQRMFVDDDFITSCKKASECKVATKK